MTTTASVNPTSFSLWMMLATVSKKTPITSVTSAMSGWRTAASKEEAIGLFLPTVFETKPGFSIDEISCTEIPLSSLCAGFGLIGPWQSMLPISEMLESIRDDAEPVLLYKPDEPRSGAEWIVAYWGEWPGNDEYCWIRCGGRPIAWTSNWGDKPVPHGVPTHYMRLSAPSV